MSDFLDGLFFKEGIGIGILHWIIVVMAVLLVLLLVSVVWDGCNAVYVKINTAEIIEEDIFVTVVEKDYDASYTTFVRTGKVTTPIHHSASYDVYLKYGDEEFVLDNEELYNRVSKNDKIPAKLLKYLSKNGKLLKTDIEIEEGS